MKKLALIIALAAALAGCKPEPNTFLNTQLSTGQSRFTVTQVGVFKDDLAYNDRRGIYLIKDIETGSEFIGISGVGISELGSHPSGKTSMPDER